MGFWKFIGEVALDTVKKMPGEINKRASERADQIEKLGDSATDAEKEALVNIREAEARMQERQVRQAERNAEKARRVEEEKKRKEDEENY